MIQVPVPAAPLELAHLILDLNGTLALDGGLLPGVAERIGALARQIDIVIVSGDTFGTAASVARGLGVPLRSLEPVGQGRQKLRIARALGPRSTAMIGNGRNDAPALAEVALGICVIGPEGASRQTMECCDVLVGSHTAGLDLLLNPRRLASTLRA